MSEDTTHDEQSRRLARALARMESLRRHRRDDGGLGAADIRLLWLLVDSGPQTLGEITVALALERSTVNRQVNAAVDAGLLAKERVPHSSAHRVHLTDAGRESFDTCAQQAVDAIGAALAQLDAEESSDLVNLVERFVVAYGHQINGEVGA